MNIKKVSKIIFISSVCFMMLFFNFGLVFAESIQEIQNQQSEIDKKIQQTSSEIANKKSQMSEALNQINNLNVEISGYQSEINTLDQRITGLDAQINEKQSKIVEQEDKYVVQKSLLEKRLVAMYESGTTSYLDMLLSSESLSDFVSKYYLISQLAEYDQELLQKIVDTKNQIQAEKDYIESAKAEIQSSRDAVAAKKQSLASAKNTKQNLVSTLSAEEKELQEQLEEFEEHKRELASQLAALARKNGITTVVAPSAAGYATPLAGRTKAAITTGYGAYKGHTGVDFAIAAGTPIYAVKSGEVVISMAKRNSKGNYSSYGEYIVIDHKDGTMTLYAHMSPGSRMVSAGQHVTQGQMIGKVGSTGNSTGPHLHFEVRIGGSPVNPTPYLP